MLYRDKNRFDGLMIDVILLLWYGVREWEWEMGDEEEWNVMEWNWKYESEIYDVKGILMWVDESISMCFV